MNQSQRPLASPPEPVSTLLRKVMADAATDERVSVGHLLDIFGVRGFAFLLLVLASLNVVIFMVPLISVLFGMPMVILAAQMVFGLTVPVFPKFIRSRTLPRERLMQGLARSVIWTDKAERFIRPRLHFLSNPRLIRLHGLLALVLAVTVTIPVPLLNTPPAVAIAMLAIGLLQKDGLFILLAYAGAAWCFILFEELGHILKAVGL